MHSDRHDKCANRSEKNASKQRDQHGFRLGQEVTWPGRKTNNSKFGVAGRVATGSQRKEEARLYTTLKAVMRILDFMPSATGNLWKAFAWESCDLLHIFQRSLFEADVGN